VSSVFAVSSVTLSRFSKFTVATTVLLFETYHLQTNPGTSVVLNPSRSSPLHAQISSSRHFKKRARNCLQNTAVSRFQSAVSFLQLNLAYALPLLNPVFIQNMIRSTLATTVLPHARSPGFESPWAR
jgi:hypothetical protein